MMRNCKVFALPAVLAAALTTTPTAVNAGGQAKPDKDGVLEKLKTMDEALKEAFKKLGDDMLYLKGETVIIKPHLRKIEDKIEKVQKDLEQLIADLGDGKGRPHANTQAAVSAADKAILDDIKARLARIEQDLAKLTTTPRTSFSPTPGGRLQLVNNYAEDLLFIVNNRPYRVAPGATQTLEEPAGTFSYEVVSPRYGLVRARTSPALAAGETFTISAR